ncbi:MAG TPA: sugar ABC transporter permease, partial [Spirochaetia bacterium]|nr:sugar ABC transporter permease [Spirochaetia bacterium]
MFDRAFRYWALLPAVVVLGLLTLYPIVQLIRMSLSDLSYTQAGISWTWVGAKNFKSILGDPIALVALRNTALFAIITVAVETVAALVLAIAVGRVKALARFYRVIVILPILIPPIAIGVMWLMIVNYNYGSLNELLAVFGIVGPAWLNTAALAFPTIIAVDIWHWISFMFLIILAGLESIPLELNEAARIDGATEMQLVRFVTLPLLRPTISVAVVLRMIFAFKVFDEIYLLTNGGPGNSTQVISSYVENVFFSEARMGYASALALVTAVIIIVFVVGYQRINKLVERASQ